MATRRAKPIGWRWPTSRAARSCRGAVDMKSGIAAGIAVLYRFAEAAERNGNLLLIATPDEEQTSQGMQAAVARLPALVRKWGLDLIGAINLDATTDRGDGRDGQAIF